MSKITINGSEFYYELHGKGHPLVLISGYCCDHTFWYPVLDQLSQKFQVLIFDNRGVGQTKDNNEELSAELMAKDVMALVRALKLKKPHIIGQSMGGTIAQIIGARYGDQISKLVLLTTSSKWRQAMLMGLKSNLLLVENEIDINILIESIMPWIFGESFLTNKDKVQEFKKSMINDPYPQSIENQKRQYKVLEKFDGTKELKSITSATLICYGREDLIALPYEAQVLASNISNSQLMEFEQSAHGMVAEIPERLTEALCRFLS